jgi:hypothetical protein
MRKLVGRIPYNAPTSLMSILIREGDGHPVFPVVVNKLRPKGSKRLRHVMKSFRNRADTIGVFGLSLLNNGAALRRTVEQ